jgi:hypothetical protein
MKAFQAEQQATKVRKRRQVLGGAALTVGEARKNVKELERGPKQLRTAPTTRTTRRQKRPATPDAPKEWSEDSSSDGSSDVSSCIVCEPLE